MHEFVCESPSVEREVILERDASGELTTLLLFVEGDAAAYERVLSEVEHVTQWTIEPADDGFYLYVRTRLRPREQQYRAALDEESVLVVPPVELRSDRTVRQTLVGESDALTAAIETFPDDVDVEVLRVGSYRHTDGATLSPRQREALRAAWETGYFDVPRTGELDAVAARLDCNTSTASDLLRRAQRRLVATALDERR